MSFSVFPNPTKDIIKIVSHSAADFDVQIVDVRGIEVFRKEFTNQTGVLDIQIAQNYSQAVIVC